MARDSKKDKKTGEEKQEENQADERASGPNEESSSSGGRGTNNSNRGKGKNMALMRKCYGVIKRRQTKITDYLMIGDVRRLARRPTKASNFCLNCRSQMEAASRREPIFIDLVSSSDDEEEEKEED